MGSYTFKWEHPEAYEVFVTGTFDDWGKTQKLDRKGEFFEKSVTLPSKEKILYKFVVDNNWTTNSHLATETDSSGNVNNVLHEHEIIHPSEAAISSAAPESTTAALAGAVPKESEKSASPPGAFPETPATEPNSFSVNPIPATEGAGNPIKLAPGESVPAPSTLTGNTISSTVKDDEELKAADGASEPTFSVNPIPATAGVGNPVNLAPGEPVPAPSTLTGNTVQSTITTDEDSYNASGSSAPVVPSSQKSADPSLSALPPVGGTMIPESSLPMGESGADAGILASTVGVGATTAALAGQVPKEPRGVPEVVTESQQEAHIEPEAAANPVAVEEKKDVEAELKSKVPEAPAAAESGFPASKVTGIVGGAVAAAGTAAAVAYNKATNTATDASTAAQGMVGPDEEKALATESSMPTETVPDVVKDSIAAAHVDPEATINPEAVHEKSAMEAELESKIKPSQEAGEPAPTVTAATSTKAPEPTGDLSPGALSSPGEKLKSSSEPNALNAAGTAAAVNKLEAKLEALDKNGTPTVTTGITTTPIEAKTEPKPATTTEAGPATPAKKTVADPATPASIGTEGTTDTPDSTKEKKKKRRSVFIQKVKKFFD